MDDLQHKQVGIQMPRLTADQWAALRLEWEGDPLATFSGLSKKFDINKSEISRKAEKEGWSKRGQIASINESAQRRADNYCDSHGNPTTQRKPNAIDLATRNESEAVRAAVLVRHRAEWSELEAFRKVALAAMKAAHEAVNREAWSIAKTAADTALANLRALEVKQEGERKSWGLNITAEEEIVISNPRGALGG